MLYLHRFLNEMLHHEYFIRVLLFPVKTNELNFLDNLNQ